MAEAANVAAADTAESTGGEEAEILTDEKSGEGLEAAGADKAGTDKGAAKAEPDAKAKADADAKAKADIELKLPEGWKADEAQLGKFKSVAKEHGLNSTQAQAIFDLYAEAQEAASKAAEAEIRAERQGWAKSLREDKDFGGTAGEKFDGHIGQAREAYQKLAIPEFRAFLKEYGLESRPEVVKQFLDLAKRDAEDTVAGTNGAGKARSQDAILRALYPSMHKQE